MMNYLNSKLLEFKKMYSLIVETLCSSKLIQSLQSEYSIELTSNTHRLNYLAADSEVSGRDGATFQVSTKASTFGIFVVKNQNGVSCCRPHYSYRVCKVTLKPMTFTFCCP